MKEMTQLWLKRLSAISLSLAMSITTLPQASFTVLAEDPVAETTPEGETETPNEEKQEPEKEDEKKEETPSEETPKEPEVEYVKVTFKLLNTTSKLEVKDSDGNIIDETSHNGKEREYSLKKGAHYTYTVSCSGYVPKTGEFDAAPDQTIEPGSFQYAEIILSQTSLEGEIGQTVDLPAIENPVNNATYTWSSADETKAKDVSGSNQLNLVGAGETTVTVTMEKNGKIKKTANVNVKVNKKTVVLSLTTSVSDDNKKVTLNVTPSDLPVSILKNGNVIKENNNGKAYVYNLKSEDYGKEITFGVKYAGSETLKEATAETKITVYKSLAFDASDVYVYEGKDSSITISKDTTDDRTYSYKVKDDTEDIITIDSSTGKITAKAIGEKKVEITAEKSESIDTYKKEINVIVKGEVSVDNKKFDAAEKVYDGKTDIPLKYSLDPFTIDGKTYENVKLSFNGTLKWAYASEGKTATYSEEWGVEGIDEEIFKKYFDVKLPETKTVRNCTVTRRTVFVKTKDISITYGSGVEKDFAVKTKSTVLFETEETGDTTGLIGEDTINKEVKQKLSFTLSTLGKEADSSALDFTKINELKTYDKELKAVFADGENEKSVGNYTYKLSEQTSSLTVNAENLTIKQLLEMVEISGTENQLIKKDGVYYLKGTDANENTAPGVLTAELKDSTYYQKVVLTPNGTDNTFSNKDQGEYQIQITLVKTITNESGESSDTNVKTVSDDKQTFKVKVDSQAPEVVFKVNEIDFGSSQAKKDESIWNLTEEVKDNILTYFTGKSVDFSISLTDPEIVGEEGSGVKSWEYYVVSKDAGEGIEKADLVDYVNNHERDGSGTGNNFTIENINRAINFVLVKAIDNVGNTSVYCSDGTILDTNKPKISVDIEAKYEVTEDKDQNKVLYMKSSEISGENSVDIKLTVEERNFDTVKLGALESLNPGEWEDSYKAEETTNNDVTYYKDDRVMTIHFTINNDTPEGTYEIAPIATDKCGNEANTFTLNGEEGVSKVIIVVDREAPTGTITTINTYGDKTTTTTEKDTVDYSTKTIAYEFSSEVKDNAKEGINNIKSVEYAVLSSDFENYEKDEYSAYQDPISVNAEGEYVVFAKLTGYNGEITYISTNTLIVDQKEPSITLSLVEDDKEYPFVGTKENNVYYNNNDVIFNGTIEDNGKNVKEYLPDLESVKKYIQDSTNGTVTSIDYDGNTTIKFTLQYSDVGKYEAKPSVKDIALNEGKGESFTVCIDKTSPKVTIGANNNTYDSLIEGECYLPAQKFEISINGTDEGGSDIKTVYYYNNESGEQSYGEFVEISNNGSFNIDANNTNVVFAKAIDKAGNVSDIVSTPILIADDQKPEVSAVFNKGPNGDNGFFNKNAGDVVLNINTLLDPIKNNTYSGLKNVTYTIDAVGTGTTKEEQGNILSESPTRATEKLTDKTIVISGYDNDDIKVTINAEDNAGNKTEYKFDQEIKIDATDPKVEITEYPSSPYYNSQAVTATVKITERNFDESLVTITSVGQKANSNPTNISWNHSGDVHTATITYTTEDHYNSLEVVCKDKAGNSSSATKTGEFVIDRTSPVIDVTFDNNNARNGKYYNAGRTATIRIKEWHLDGNEVRIDGASCNNWSRSGEYLTGTISFNTDGEYSFTVNCTDKAGNRASANSVSQFVIDLTNPAVDITGVKDHSANNGVVAPIIVYTDTNFSTNNGDIHISLTGDHNGAVNIDDLRTAIANGQSITMNDFEHVIEMDDIYTLVVEIVDLAGNSTSRKIVFSVNRFGSNFRAYDDPTKNVFDKYYLNEEKQVVIEEIGVDPLQSYNVSYGCDGEIVQLTEGKDYTTKKTGNAESWNSTVYTLNAKNFEEEGMYDIIIDSIDTAGNDINNKTKEVDFNFIIDKTAPSATIKGVEDNSEYKVDFQEIIASLSDNYALEKAEIYLDNNETPVAEFDAEQIKEYKGEIPYKLASSNKRQDITVKVYDAAGNESSKSKVGILVTSNVFIQFINNKIFVGLVGLIVLIIGAYIAWRKKQEQSQKA